MKNLRNGEIIDFKVMIVEDFNKGLVRMAIFSIAIIMRAVRIRGKIHQVGKVMLRTREIGTLPANRNHPGECQLEIF